MNQALRDLITETKAQVSLLHDRCDDCTYEETVFEVFAQALTRKICLWVQMNGGITGADDVDGLYEHLGLLEIPSTNGDFEAWYGYNYSWSALETWNGSRYTDLSANQAWHAWQAARGMAQ